MACKLGCGLFLSPQLIRNENQTKVNTVLIGTKFGNIKVFEHKDEQRGKNKENKGVFVFGSSFSGLRFRVFVFGS